MKLYTPLQILIATFLGGPFVATYLLSENFKTRKQKANFKKTFIGGAVLSVLSVLALPFLPDVIPTTLMAFVYLGVAGLVVHLSQLKKGEITISKKFECKTVGNTVIAGIIGFLVYAAAVFMFGMIMAQLGYV